MPMPWGLITYLPCGLILELMDYYHVPVITRSITLVSYLTMNKGFSFYIKSNGCSFYLNDIFFNMEIYDNGL